MTVISRPPLRPEEETAIPTTANTVETIDPYLRLPAVLAATGLTERTLYRRVAAGTFPSPKQLGPNSVGWRQSAVKEWNDSRPDARAAA